MRSWRTPLAAAILLAGLSLSVFAATHTVTNTLDSGPGSLRQAIDEVNASCREDPSPVIAFNIPYQRGSLVIAPSSPFPIFHCGLTVDATTQPGSRANDAPEAFNAWLPIALDGINVRGEGSTNCGLHRGLGEGQLTVRGLEIRNFKSGAALCGQVGAYGNRLIDNLAGLMVRGPSIVGGSAPAERNVLSGNFYGINQIDFVYALKVANNLIGTDDSGTQPHPNNYGILLSTMEMLVEHNVIAANNVGIHSKYLTGPVAKTIANNRIGEGVGGVALGNGVGIALATDIHDVIEGNTIANNHQGIRILSSQDVTVTGGSMHSNGEDASIEVRAGLAPTSLVWDFAELPVGGASPTRSIVAYVPPRTRDTGLAGDPIVLTGLDASLSCNGQPICSGTPFACDSGCTHGPFEAETCAVTVAFRPSIAGTFSTTFYVCASDGSRQIVTLKGTAVGGSSDPDPPPATPGDRSAPVYDPRAR